MPLIDIDAKNKPYEDAIRGSGPPPVKRPLLSYPSGFSVALRLCGFIDFVVGLFGALVVWSNAPSSYAGPSSLYIALALGLGFQGVLFCVLFNVIAEMSENLRAIADVLAERRLHAHA